MPSNLETLVCSFIFRKCPTLDTKSGVRFILEERSIPEILRQRLAGVCHVVVSDDNWLGVSSCA